MPARREVLFVTGEASGDLHAGPVAAALAARRPDLHQVAIGGDRLRAAGAEVIVDCRDLSAMGFVEVIGAIPRHWRLLTRLRERFARGHTALVVLLDYPGFNLRVATAARAAGIPVLYYITPQVWAWGKGRLARMSRDIAHAAVILPFEAPLLESAGIPTTFVGHPLAEHAAALPTRAEARRTLGLAPDVPVLALFPGSRTGEIARHWAPMRDAALRLQAERPGLEVLVAQAPGRSVPTSPFRTVVGAAGTIYRAADAALSKSGTNTLEAAVAGCPLVVGYRANPLTVAIARRLVALPHVSLVNIVAGREVVPELIQEAMTADALAARVRPLLVADAPERRAQLEGLGAVAASLGEPGAAARVAAIADRMVP
ncbi:MAG: lipid-A-disaccharide synthase [Gemmatimonadaceae bacterium]|nr:lipid-A-disaccharide synthase [Gemmatimonadaceae bacterium]